MIKVNDISEFLNGLAPFENKCEWDNCGLLIGDGEKEVKSVGYTLDLTLKTVRKAVESGADLVITHHPVIFRPQKNFLAGDPVFEAAKNGIAVISCHTCYDCAENGVSEILADTLELKNISVIETEEKPFCVRKGETDEAEPEKFAKFIAKKLGTTVRFVKGAKPVKTVAVCGGGGGDFVNEVIAAGADAYVTGDLSHHHLLTAENAGLTLIAAGHFETENIAMKPLADRLAEHFKQLNIFSLGQENPVEYIV